MNSLKSPIFIAFLLMIFITNHNESNAQTLQEDFDDFISCFDKEQFNDCAKMGSQLLLRLNDNFEMYYSVNYVMAIIEYEGKNYPKALQYVETSLLIKESMSQFTDVQGRGNWLKSEILGAQGKSGASYRCLKKASKYIRSAEFHSTVAYRLIEKGKYKKAVKLATSAIYMDPSYAYAYNNRGLAYLRLNKIEEAKTDFKKIKGIGCR